jgi:sugar phosphate permease
LSPRNDAERRMSIVERHRHSITRGSVLHSPLFARGQLTNELRQLLANGIFVSLCLSLSGIFFIVTGIQFWLPKYLQDVLNYDQEKSALIYMVVCFTGPVAGVIVGGLITNAYGGYNSRDG